jgi:hypothetical protein
MTSTINGQQYTTLWSSDNGAWRIVKRQYMPGPRGYAIEIHRRNQYDYFEHVTPFDIWIPKYVETAWQQAQEQPR